MKKKLNHITLRNRIVSLIFGIIGIFFFFLAIVFPTEGFRDYFLVSTWDKYPFLSIAAILFFGFAASFPIWHSSRRAWLLPFVASFIFIGLDVVLFANLFHATVVGPSSLGDLWVHGDMNTGAVFFVPIWLSVISSLFLLTESMNMRKAGNFIDVD